VINYVLDDVALIAGLVGNIEHHRRELSRLLHDAIDGGPTLEIPALCLSTAALARPAIADHVADLVAAAPTDAIAVAGLVRTDHLDALLALCPGLGWPATHAAVRALIAGSPVLTAAPDRYTGTGVDILAM